MSGATTLKTPKTIPAADVASPRGLKLDPATARRIAKAATAAGQPVPPHVQAALDDPAPAPTLPTPAPETSA